MRRPRPNLKQKCEAKNDGKTDLWNLFKKIMGSERGAVGDLSEPVIPGTEFKTIEEAAKGFEDLNSTVNLFKPEEITAKKQSVWDTAVEDDRRSKLSPADRKAEDKAKADSEAAKDNEKVPDTYEDFKIPGGMDVDNKLLAEAMPMFKELGLSQAKAQKVVDLYSTKIVPAFMKRQVEAWNTQKETWKAATAADKEIGGDKFNASVADAVRVLNTLGTPELKKVFDEYGLGNHPEFVRVFARMAKQLKEDTIDTGKAGASQGPTTLESMAKEFYKKE